MFSVQSPHLIVPFSRCSADAWLATMKALPADSFKNLDKLLQGMKLEEVDTGEAHSLSTPHERVLSKTIGLMGRNAVVDGLIPWAAWAASNAFKASAITEQITEKITGKAWAYITPCHWAMGREHATMTDPAALVITPSESRTLLAAMQPYFETEGITLHYLAPEQWLAEGELFRALPTASLDRVLGRNVDRWLPPSRAMKLLQNEMQMLLYTHPVNDARSAKGQRSINSFWLSGTGSLNQALTSRNPSQAHLPVPRGLAQAAFTDDWSAYTQAWQALDRGEVAALLGQQNAGQTVRLTLCGESNAHTFETAPKSLLSKILSIMKPKPTLMLLEQL